MRQQSSQLPAQAPWPVRKKGVRLGHPIVATMVWQILHNAVSRAAGLPL